MPINKAANIVYSPVDSLERAVQNSYHKYTGQWLTAFECRLTAKAISALKSEWLSQDKTLMVRIDHLFNPEMIGRMEQMVLPTHLFFLRDILENHKISEQIHSPITLVSKKLAHFLFQDFPIHVVIKKHALKMNDAIQVGGLLIFEERVELPPDAIEGVDATGLDRELIIENVQEIVRSIKGMSLNKMAVRMVGPGVFGLENIELNIRADQKVQNKVNKKIGIIDVIEPGDEGLITVKYNDGMYEVVDRIEFVRGFIYW